MKGLVQLIVCTAVGLAVSGCLVDGGNESKEKRQIVGSNDSSSFSNCEKLLKKVYETTTDHDDNYIVSTHYRYKKNRCINLNVGWYRTYTKSVMSGFFAGATSRARTSGNFDAAVRFLDRTGITCEDSGKSLELIFPVHADDHDEAYKEIMVECSRPERQMMVVYIGLDKRNGNRLALTIWDAKSDPRMRIFHVFDTNRDGEIIKHIKVVGENGREQVLLDR